MKTVKIRLNTTVEYEVTRRVADDCTDDELRNMADDLERDDLYDEPDAKQLCYYTEWIGWDVVPEELEQC
jgi:hypothetical protein